MPLYRQFNPNVNPRASRNNSGSHNYTTSKAENDKLVSLGWKAEGIGWYGLNTSAPAHTHNWVADTEQVWHANVVTVTDEPAWDEPIYENHSFCSCGVDVTLDPGSHRNGCPNGGGGRSKAPVQVGTQHHDAVTHTEDQGWYETVTTGYHCSGCGATK